MSGPSPKLDHTFLDRIFASRRFRVIKDPQLENSEIGRQIAAAWPLAITNFTMITVFGINSLVQVDFDCTCGQCIKCEANIRMLDHSLDVAGYRLRMSLKAFAANLHT